MKETLFGLTGQMAGIEAALEESGGELTPELESAWEETSASLAAKVDNYNALILKLDAYSENIGTEIKRLQALKKTADNSLKRVKEHVRDVMVANGMDRLEGAYCKMWLRRSTVTVVEEDTALKPYQARLDRLMLPPWITAELKVSKAALKDEYKDKDITPAGVSFAESVSLGIK